LAGLDAVVTITGGDVGTSERGNGIQRSRNGSFNSIRLLPLRS